MLDFGAVVEYSTAPGNDITSRIKLMGYEKFLML
jgi:hypothetical protein